MRPPSGKVVATTHKRQRAPGWCCRPSRTASNWRANRPGSCPASLKGGPSDCRPRPPPPPARWWSPAGRGSVAASISAPPSPWRRAPTRPRRRACSPAPCWPRRSPMPSSGTAPTCSSSATPVRRAGRWRSWRTRCSAASPRLRHPTADDDSDRLATTAHVHAALALALALGYDLPFFILGKPAAVNSPGFE